MENNGQSSIIFFIAITLFVSALFFVLLLNAQKKKDKSEGETAGTNLIEAVQDSSNAENNPVEDVEELKIETVKEGEGDVAEVGDTLVVNYEGTFLDGTIFDSSYARNQPFEFTLGQGMVIQGWDEGMKGMKVGEERMLTIPSDMAYGPDGRGSIPGGAALVFKVELLEIK